MREKIAPATRSRIAHVQRSHSVPPASARTPPASCRRRWARSTARNGRRGPLPTAQADARAATSRARRTSGGNGPAAGRPVQWETRSGCGAAQPRAMPPGWVRRGAADSFELNRRAEVQSPRPACGERSDRAAIRVRGSHSVLLTIGICGSSPSPQPSPRESGEREKIPYSVTAFSEICQSLPSKIEMCSVFIGE